ncbi:MAG: SIS domain-containing protein [Oscillospiraceae bacterium]
MDREDCNNSMRLESYDLQKFARQLFELNGQQILDSLKTSDYMTPTRVIAAGCGDSYCAAFASEPAFRELVGIPMVGRPAVEISRCYDPKDFDNVLFYGISSRGRTQRVIEAAMRVKALSTSSKAVAIVNYLVDKSPLEKECDLSLYVRMPKFECGQYTEHAPCQRSYFSTMFTMMLQAIKMGEVRGRYDSEQAKDYINAIIEYAESFDDDLLKPMDDRMWEIAKKWNEFRQFEVVGSGDDVPTTWFVAAKFVEAFGDIATYETPENWMSSCRYAKNPEKIGTVVILDKDSESFDYTMKVIDEMVKIGRPVIVFTDADAKLFPLQCEVFQEPSPRYRFIKPIMQYCPIGFLCGYIKEMRGVSFYRFGGECDDERGTMNDKVADLYFEKAPAPEIIR